LKKYNRKEGKMNIRRIVFTGALLCAFIMGAAKISYAQNDLVQKLEGIGEDLKIEEMVKAMTLDEKLAQMMMPAIRTWKTTGKAQNFQTLNPQVKNALARYKFGGIILFAENLANPAQVVSLINDMQNVAVSNDFAPMFIGMDQEGGQIWRLPFGARLIGNMALGAIDDESFSYLYGQLISEQLKVLGVNLNFAPDVDVNLNPNNPVIGLRSFSDKPDIVSSRARAVISGLHSNNIATAIKHFPGHGDTHTDTHIGLASSKKTLKELRASELIPFAALSQDTDLVMTAHIANSNLDPNPIITTNNVYVARPATLSSATLSILRTELNFQGLIISDALNMGAIKNHFDEIEAVIEAFKAGIDIALMPIEITNPNDMEKYEALFATLKNAVANGEISESKIDISVAKILKLKDKMGILETSQYKIKTSQKIKDAEDFFKAPEMYLQERRMADAGIVLVKNDNAIPIKTKSGDKILFLAPTQYDKAPIVSAIDKLVLEGAINKESRFEILDFGQLKWFQKEEWEATFKDYDYVIVVSKIFDFAKDGWQAPMVETIIGAAKSSKKRLVVISGGLPYDIAYYGDAKTIVSSLGWLRYLTPDTPMPNIQGCMDIIFGYAKPNGKLPVDIHKVNKHTGVFKKGLMYKAGFGLEIED
jgi:beta-N-acetylhexosaminidase